jgi:hypothetical protein
LSRGDRRRIIRCPIIAAFLLLFSPAAASPAEQAPDPAPPLAGAARAAGELPRLHSLLVSRRGELIVEWRSPSKIC